ncbi:hypothetical protein DRO58_07685 [Candidatus Bathyarchaeota archaeon]|nr:MAG: hypothetical protein DRO58_07685 [Candidatus Bathyarchaeota archaeon]
MTRVLIVDDSKFMRLFIRKALESYGLKDIEEAESGEEAIEKCEKTSPSLIFLDINMPKLNGLKLLEIFHKRNPSVKIIMITALSQKFVIKEAFQKGAVAYITKPFSMEKLLAVVKRLIQNEPNR